jgi:secreted Zn-dependent insulinase-like peptidase
MRYWNEIKNSSYLFNRKLDIVKTLKNLSLVDVIQFFDEFIYDSQTRRKFSSRFLGNNPTTEDTTNEESERKEGEYKYLSIDNYAIFKRSMPLEPVYICNV